MALSKPIKQSNGIVLNYHRIADIRNVVNEKTYLDVISYVDKTEREKEQKQPKYSPNREEVYKMNNIYNLPYNDTLTIEDAYEYLKTLEVFGGSEDI